MSAVAFQARAAGRPEAAAPLAAMGVGPAAQSAAPHVASRQPYLRVERLSKSYGAFHALREVSLEVFEGELVCFLGPSGCGKTTLLRAIAGLTPQDTGTIEQAGREISRLPPSRRDYGIVFQSYALFPNLTVAANVGYGLGVRRLPRAGVETRVKELLELVGLPSSAAKYPNQLSGGQQQRVALARALATSPGLLLLDEPLSALDARVRAHLRHEIKHLARRLRLTTILVTHDQEEALAMADRIVVMNHGVIEQVGTPLEIYRQPATPFVADFVGRMNSIPGLLAADGGVRIGTRSFEVDPAGLVAVNGLRSGDGATVCVRPEDVVVERSDAPLGRNELEVTIDTLDFLGSFFRATLLATEGGGAPILADLSVQVVRALGLSEGERIRARLPAERLRIFPSVSAAS